MRVLMISLDRRLLAAGDVVERHQKYADLAGQLDIIVFSKTKLSREWSKNLRVYATGSTKWFHYHSALALARHLIGQTRYGLLVTQDLAAPVGAKIKQLFNFPLLISFHSMFFTSAWYGFNPVKMVLFWQIRKAAREADAFRVVNSKIQEQLAAWGLTQPVLTEPTPVDIRRFFIQDKQFHPIPTILFVGRLTSAKNVVMLIEAFTKLKSQAVLRIVGDGPERSKLERLAAGNKQIAFLGQKGHDELPGIYEKADIFVLPSKTESFGWVLLEAAAAKCAIIATRTPGAASIIKHEETGILIELGDEPRLVSILEKLIADKDLRLRLGEKAQEEARHHDAQQGIVRVVNFWKQIAQKL